MIKCTYSPQISPGNSDLTPIPASGPTLTHRATVEFTYPYVSPSITMEIRNPELGNSLALQLKRIVNTSRGNKVDIYRPQNWPKATILDFEIVGLSWDDVLNLRDFITNSLGKEIGYLDYESQQYRGFITTPGDPVRQTGPGCGFVAHFTFEGELA